MSNIVTATAISLRLIVVGTIIVGCAPATKSHVEIKKQKKPDDKNKTPEALPPEIAKAVEEAPVILPPVPVPITELLEGLSARSYLQTRSVVTLKLTQDFVGTDGGKLSLINISNHVALIEDEQITPQGTNLTADGDGFAIMSPSFDIFIRIYPEDQSLISKFRYGENRLKATLSDKRTTSTTVWLKDFDFRATGYGSFAYGLQRRQGFQGWVSPVYKSTVSNGSVLSVNFGRLVNN